nr:DUF1697 domain-containing protein [Roseibium limicola]
MAALLKEVKSMPIWVALFRGINVGGHRKVPMKALRGLFERLEFTDVKTYIQSGNAVFASSQHNPERIGTTLSEAFEREFGFAVQILVLSADAFVDVLNACPFQAGEADENLVHVFFFAEGIPASDVVEPIEKVRAATEQIHLGDRAFYLRAPDGIGRSRLVSRIDRLLGVPTTARNLKSVSAIAALTA